LRWQPARAWNQVKGFTLLEELDKTSTGRSFSSNLGACLDKYVDVFAFPKVSQNLELRKVTKQTSKTWCIGLNFGKA